MATFIDWGNGHDGAVSSANGTINTYAAMTGTAGSSTVTTALSVAVGDMVLLHQSRGTANVGKWELVRVSSTGSGQFTADRNLTNTYAAVSQAVLIPQYTGGTCANALTGTAWGGTSGGIIALMCNGLLTLSSTSNVNAIGYRGATAHSGGNGADYSGEGTVGASANSQSANGNGGGAGENETSGAPARAGAGGGGNGAVGTAGTGTGGSSGGTGGTIGGVAALTTMVFGGGGGDCAKYVDSTFAVGGNGGGIVIIIAKQFTLSGAMTSTGGAGALTSFNGQGSGGGAGGSILIKSQIATLGTNLFTASGGAGGIANSAAPGGTGAVGRIHLDYLTSYTGTTNPTLDVTQDKSLADKGGSFLYNLI